MTGMVSIKPGRANMDPMGGLMRRTAGLVVALALVACSEAEVPAHLAIPGADPDRGRALIAAKGCGTCHFVQGVEGADGRVAPRLENFASRTLIAGTVPNVPRFLVPWLMDPPALKARTAMPNLGIGQADAMDIASYLYTLGGGDIPPRVPAAVGDNSGLAFEALLEEQKGRLENSEVLGIEGAMEALASD
jgi:mono/diheme cytochrome c family protein